MRIVYLNAYYDTDLTTSDDLLDRYRTSLQWCAAVHRAGVEEVIMLQRFRVGAMLERDGVRVHMIADGLPPSPGWKRNPAAFIRECVGYDPDVVHVNGTPSILPSLKKQCRPSSALLWQHHGGPDPRGFRRWLYHMVLSRCDAVLFTSRDQGEDWKQMRILAKNVHVYDVIESSTSMTSVDCRQAREKTGLHGDPVFLWVGRLDENKDPLTVLTGFAHAVSRFPDPHLYMVFSHDRLLQEVRSQAESLDLKERVHLLGRIVHEDMHWYYSASDYFLLGSHREGSGFAIIEALACGVYPIVPNIAAFSAITRAGKMAALWDRGSSESLREALWSLSDGPSRREIRNFFDEHLSWVRIGEKAAGIYRAARRNGAR